MFDVRLARRDFGLIRCDRPEVTLWVRSGYGDYVRVRFAIDTGADLAAMPVAFADQQGIRFRRHDSGSASGLAGRARRYQDEVGLLIGGEPFVWPCLFIETPPDVEGVMPVLGRAGLLDTFDFCLGRATCALSRRGRWRERLWRLWPWRRVHGPNEPL
jgi:hypothetical protein